MKKYLLIASVMVSSVLAGINFAPVAFAAPTNCSNPAECVTNSAKDAKTGGPTDFNVLVKTIVNVLLYIIGALAVIMIVVGGIRYVISNGNPENVTKAKNTIIYAVAGLVVALLAYAIVNFVLVALIPKT